jgi:hypothetical protein
MSAYPGQYPVFLSLPLQNRPPRPYAEVTEVLIPSGLNKGGCMDHRFKGWTKDWIHPAVRRGTIYWTAQAIGITGGAVLLIFLALQQPTAERVWWAAAFVIAAVLSWFLTNKQIQKLQQEYRYEDDDNATDQS